MESKEMEEKFANDFANALLMPEKEVRKRYNKKNTFTTNILILASYFGVPIETMSKRLLELGLKQNERSG